MGTMVSEPLTTFRSPKLLRLTATEAQARSLIARHGADMRIQWRQSDKELHSPRAARLAAPDATDEQSVIPDDIAGDVWYARFAPAIPAGLREVCGICKELDWAGARLRLSLAPSAVSGWLSANLARTELDGLVEPLLSAGVEELVSQVCAAVGRVSAGGAPRLSATSVTDRALPHSWTVTAHHELTGTTFHALIECDALGLMLLASLIQRAPVSDNGIVDKDVPVRLSATLGWSSIKAAELHKLRPLDIIFIDNYLVTADGDLWLTAGARGLRIKPQGASYRITKGWTTVVNEISMHEEDVNGSASGPTEPEASGAMQDTTLDLNSVPMRLTFSLGERMLTYGELQQLQPGETFDLSRPLASGPVIIRVNGAWLGTGDLVEIDGRVGVTLRELGNPTP